MNEKSLIKINSKKKKRLTIIFFDLNHLTNLLFFNNIVYVIIYK